MDNIEKRIDIVKNIIIKYFYDNDIKSSCLAQSYIFYKYLYKLNSAKENIPIPKLIKGYILNQNQSVYYGHFWVEFDNKIYDISTDTYLLYYDFEDRKYIKDTMRILKKNISNKILSKYKNIDNPLFNTIRDESYKMCMENDFLEDVKNKASIKIYNQIKFIYDKLKL